MGMVIKSNMKYSNHIVVIVIYCDYFLNFFNFSQFFSIFLGGPILINVLARSDFLNFSQFFSIFLNFSFLFILSHFLSFFNILFHVIVVFHKFLT